LLEWFGPRLDGRVQRCHRSSAEKESPDRGNTNPDHELLLPIEVADLLRVARI